MTSEIDKILSERQKTHGDFFQQAETAARLKLVMRDSTNWERVSYPRKEALDHIAVKISRILNGDSEYEDSWKDIMGYCQLILNNSKEDEIPF